MERQQKPPHGAPCNRCGLCCEAVLCPLGSLVFGDRDGPCPALSFDGQLSVCGLVAAPAQFVRVRAAMVGPTLLSQAAVVLIGAGIGCDAQLEGEPRDRSFIARMIAFREAHRETIAKAFKAWGLRWRG